MKAQLYRGKIDVPSSLADAKLRVQQLDHELKRIAAQITSEDRVSRYPTKAEYNAWHKRATIAQGLLGEERKQLAEWITNTEGSAEGLLVQAETLLGEALDLLQQVKEDGGLEPDELPVLEKIDNYFAVKNEHETVRYTASWTNGKGERETW
jgi:hypothetical protein